MLSLGKRSHCNKHLFLLRCSPLQQRQAPAAAARFPCAQVTGKWERGGRAALWGCWLRSALGVCLHPAVLPERPQRVHGWRGWPARLDPCSRSPLGSWHSSVEEESHTPSPSCIPPGYAAMSHAPQGSGGEDPWPPCPLGTISWGAQGCVGATKTCSALMQAVSREDASRGCSSPCCLALRFAKVITESYHLVLRSTLLPLPSGLERGALYTT